MKCVLVTILSGCIRKRYKELQHTNFRSATTRLDTEITKQKQLHNPSKSVFVRDGNGGASAELTKSAKVVPYALRISLKISISIILFAIVLQKD